ncbi:MAG: type II/IV secretion system protein [Cyanothece sp. SIO1E1]|nr:type II/IV secretion system protein [Cyanothece sp. SIO1E1]
MQQAIDEFLQSTRPLIDILVSITGQPLPHDLLQFLLRHAPAFAFPLSARKLIQAGYVNAQQMHQALFTSQNSDRSLPDILAELTGEPMSPELLRQYQQKQLFEAKILYGVESFNLDASNIPWPQISQLIDSLIPLDICRRYHALPLMASQTQPAFVQVAMVDPANLAAEDDLNQILRSRGFRLQRMVITAEDYQQLISKYLDEMVVREQHWEYEKSVDVRGDLEGLNDLDLEDTLDADTDFGVALAHAEAAPVIALVNKILVKAVQEEVSAIHIEPQEDFLRVRFRKDGVLRPAIENLPKKVTPAVTARFKIIANLDIAERRVPQNGRIRRVFQDRKIDFRVSTLPSRYGEKVVLRILDNSVTQLGLDQLITDEASLNLVKGMVARPFGLILVTGPTGSGKTTTLYSALAERNHPGINISTAEDAIEYTLPGLTQVQVLSETGTDYLGILRGLLHQDPDVILIGDLLDPETTKTALKAALRHLLLVSFLGSDIADIFTNFQSMGIASHLVARSLVGVINQRLVRQVCPRCRIAYFPDSHELVKFGLPDTQQSETLYHAKTLTPEEIQQAKAQNKLCPVCNGVGYQGRIGVYEVMRVTEPVKALMTQNASLEEIRHTAVQSGDMKTLWDYGLALVLQGLTTLAEIEQVLLPTPQMMMPPPPIVNPKSSSTNLQVRMQTLEQQIETLQQQIQQLKRQFESE